MHHVRDWALMTQMTFNIFFDYARRRPHPSVHDTLVSFVDYLVDCCSYLYISVVFIFVVRISVVGNMIIIAFCPYLDCS